MLSAVVIVATIGALLLVVLRAYPVPPSGGQRDVHDLGVERRHRTRPSEPTK